jgi:EVE domain-containing protein
VTAWLAVVSKDHVMRGVALGIAQVGHGKRPPLARMRPGDGFVYYSPRRQLGGGASLQAFTALGEITDDEIWQADEGSFTPWRRRCTYRPDVTDTPIRDLALDLTEQPNWGHQMRRGLVELTEHDFELISTAMTTA